MVPLQRESTPVSVEKERKEETPMEVDDSAEPKGDPEVAPKYVQRLLPVFTHVFQSSMIQSIRWVYYTVYISAQPINCTVTDLTMNRLLILLFKQG